MEWNRKLIKSAHCFTQAHPGATAMVYSSHHTFTQVLNSPASYGFDAEQVIKEGGAIWVDNIHPTTAMHEIIAVEMSAFLGDTPAYVANE